MHLNGTFSKVCFNSPTQPLLSVSRVKPVLQLQVNPGSSLVHVWAHPPLLVRHWSTSEEQNMDNCRSKNTKIEPVS